MSKYNFDICNDTVTIYKNDKQIAHWIIDEWIEDPSIVPDIIWAFLHPKDTERVLSKAKKQLQ
jgi:hypothetical protein